MSSKIIFWIDRTITEFGIAKYLQDKVDHNLYAIYEITDKPKEFFEKQKFVSFKKQWFYFDHVQERHRTPDLEYLKTIEENYGINIWLLAYNDRIFYNYNEYYKFSTDEVLSIIEQECRFFESVLDSVNPDYLITHDTYSQPHRLFYLLCKAKGVKILLMAPSRVGNLFEITDESDKFRDLEDFEEDYQEVKMQPLEFLQSTKTDTLKNYTDVVENSKRDFLHAGLKFWFSDNSKEKKFYTYFGRTEIKVLIKTISYQLKIKCREYFMNRNLPMKLETSSSFLYFPLHMEQESAMLLGAPFYLDQIGIIKNVAKTLPIGYKLLVKDHFVMKTRGWRSIRECKEIMDLPNVILMHPLSDGKNILEKCSLVVAVKGTSSIEAAFQMKPSIVFENSGSYRLPSVHKITSFHELPVAIRNGLKKKVKIEDLKKFMGIVSKNSFLYQSTELEIAIQQRFNFGGYLADGIYPHATKEMERFLVDFKSKFEFLVSEYMKKIRY